jgi:hypothetical protein
LGAFYENQRIAGFVFSVDHDRWLTNHLQLLGENSISTTGIPSLTLQSPAPTVTLHVHKTFNTDARGTLKIESVGRSYTEPSKPKEGP